MWRKSSLSALIGAALIVATSSYGQENWFGAISSSDCAKFSKLSVAFADDSSRSPASMFGHTFLVLHNEARPEQDSMVVEFVGDTSGSDIAAMRALFWSIPGKFIIRRFAYKLLEYGREGRDVRVWRVGEVPANCEETLQSFMRDDLEYSFLRKNCSWHTERLASALRNSNSEFRPNLISIPVPFTIPVKTLDQFVRQDQLEDANYSSPRRRAVSAEEKLSVREREGRDQILAGNIAPSGFMSAGMKRAVVTAANVLLNDEPSAERRNEIFRTKRKFLSAGPEVSGRAAQELEIPTRRKVAAIGLSALNANAGFRLAGQLGMRNIKMPSLGSRDSGQLEVFDFSARGDRKRLNLERLGLVRLDASTPDSIFIPGFTRLIDVAYEVHRDAIGVPIQEEAGLRFGGGKTIAFGDGVASALLIGTFRYMRVPVNTPVGFHRAWEGPAARLSLRLRNYFSMSTADRFMIVAERFLNDRLPVAGLLDAMQVHDFGSDMSIHLGYRGILLSEGRIVNGNWEIGLTRSM